MADSVAVMAAATRTLHAASAAVAASGDVGDPQASRTVYGVVVVLAAVGFVLVGLAVWLFRTTRPDPALLAPLERMESRRWRRLDPQARRRLLDEARPDGAEPLARAQQEPEVDSEFASIRPVTDFEDLAERKPSKTVPVHDEPDDLVPVAQE